MPESKEPKLDLPEEAAPECTEPAAEDSLAEIHTQSDAAVAREKAAEVESGKPKKKKELRRFNPHETARVDSLAGLPLASFKQRLIAFIIDFLIVGSAVAVVVALINYLLVSVWHVQEHLLDVTKEHVQVHAQVEFEKINETVQAIAMLLYFGLSVWRTNGLTLGKRIMRIRVVSLTHERITLWQSCERALGYGASMLEAGFGFFQFFIYPNRTCVHDRIAETIVVQEPKIKSQEPKIKSQNPKIKTKS